VRVDIEHEPESGFGKVDLASERRCQLQRREPPAFEAERCTVVFGARGIGKL
jgi:hypothetical protein